MQVMRKYLINKGKMRDTGRRQSQGECSELSRLNPQSLPGGGGSYTVMTCRHDSRHGPGRKGGKDL